MGIPVSQMWTVATYVLRQKFARRERYPLVLMLEPLFRCNLACAGCGKIQYPAHVLKMNLSPEECFRAVDECGAPMVSIPGGSSTPSPSWALGPRPCAARIPGTSVRYLSHENVLPATLPLLKRLEMTEPDIFVHARAVPVTDRLVDRLLGETPEDHRVKCPGVDERTAPLSHAPALELHPVTLERPSWLPGVFR